MYVRICYSLLIVDVVSAEYKSIYHSIYLLRYGIGCKSLRVGHCEALKDKSDTFRMIIAPTGLGGITWIKAYHDYVVRYFYFQYID